MTPERVCKSQGYATSAFGKWHLGWTSAPVTDWSKPLKPGPRELGFDHYFGMASNIPNGPHSFIEISAVVGHIAGQSIVVEGSGQGAKTTGIEKPWEPNRVMETLTTHATRWIDANCAAPFFVYFAPNAVHDGKPGSRLAGNCGAPGCP